MAKKTKAAKKSKKSKMTVARIRSLDDFKKNLERAGGRVRHCVVCSAPSVGIGSLTVDNMIEPPPPPADNPPHPRSVIVTMAFRENGDGFTIFQYGLCSLCQDVLGKKTGRVTFEPDGEPFEEGGDVYQDMKPRLEGNAPHRLLRALHLASVIEDE